MNAKKAKQLRRQAKEIATGGGYAVKTHRNGRQTMYNAPASVRMVYRALKAA